jgi:hypothetical protein
VHVCIAVYFNEKKRGDLTVRFSEEYNAVGRQSKQAAIKESEGKKT